MRGFGFSEHGDADRLGWVGIDEPRPGPGEVRLRVAAAAFNRLDRFVLAGIPGVEVERPHVLGSDASGWVDSVGEGVRDLAPGEPVLLNPGIWDGSCEACRAGREALCRDYRIVGEHSQGTLAPFVVVPRRSVHPKPEGLTFEQAAAAPLVFQTAWRALLGVGELRPGETVALIGAGGGVATAALQVARWRGARTVVLSRSLEKLERARALGAEATLPIPPDGAFDRALWAWSGKRGIDLIFDPSGEQTVPRSVRALARGGRLVVIGATTGPIAPIDLRPLFWRQASLRGSTMADRAQFEEMYQHLARGELTPVVDSVFDIERAAEAYRRFQSPDLFGKVVVRVGLPAAGDGA
ncbi:MAG: zinc-binding dehydrogenase [Thermoplasmata archaeon]